MKYKIIDLKILENYDIEKSKDFDMKIEVSFEKNFWPIKKKFNVVCFRNNPVYGDRSYRWYSGHTTSCGGYYMENGEPLESKLEEKINSHFEKILMKETILKRRSEMSVKIKNLNNNSKDNL